MQTKSYEEFIMYIQQHQEGLRERIEEIAHSRNGKQISLDEIVQESAMMNTEVTAAYVHAMLRGYHDWLLKEVLQLPAE